MLPFAFLYSRALVPGTAFLMRLLVFIGSLHGPHSEARCTSSPMPSGHWGDLLGAGHPHVFVHLTGPGGAFLS